MENPRSSVLSLAEIVRRLPAPLRGRTGVWLCRMAMRVTAIDRVNALYARCREEEGWRFAAAVLDDLNIRVAVEVTPSAAAFLDRMAAGRLSGEMSGGATGGADGGFFTVSNHPLGALDGIALTATLGRIRSDFRIFANPVLMRIEALRPALFPIDPMTGAESRAANRAGLLAALRHLRDGHPLGLFPAGSVARWHVGRGIRDATWRTAAGKLIRQARLPVLPVYVDERNSWFFYGLGLVDWRLRTLRLPREVFRRRDGTLRLVVRDPIDAERLARMGEAAALAATLQKITVDGAV